MNPTYATHEPQPAICLFCGKSQMQGGTVAPPVHYCSRNPAAHPNPYRTQPVPTRMVPLSVIQKMVELQHTTLPNYPS